MVDNSNLKIQLFQGINDNPSPPTEFEAGNGSHLIAQFNALIQSYDTTIQALQTQVTELSNQLTTVSTTLDTVTANETLNTAENRFRAIETSIRADAYDSFSAYPQAILFPLNYDETTNTYTGQVSAYGGANFGEFICKNITDFAGLTITVDGTEQTIPTPNALDDGYHYFFIAGLDNLGEQSVIEAVYTSNNDLNVQIAIAAWN